MRTAGAAGEAASIVLELELRLVEDQVLHPAAMRLARRLGLVAACDAHDPCLASSLGADLWTADRQLVGRAGGQLPFVRLAVP